MEWTRSETLALAANACTYCHGLGLRTGRRGHEKPCLCVFRSVFRICFTRFRLCHEREKHKTSVTLEGNVWSRKNEEYVVDFLNVTRRSLSEEDWKIFNYHFLLGADWRLCTRKLGIDRGSFFHEVYRITERLGRIYRELQPYPLFSLSTNTSTEPPGSKAASSSSAKAAAKVRPSHLQCGKPLSSQGPGLSSQGPNPTSLLLRAPPLFPQKI